MRIRLSVLVFLLLLFLSPLAALGAGTITDSGEVLQTTGEYTLRMACVGDASTGSFPSTNTSVAIDGYVYLVVTDPDTPAPTDNYDIVLYDSDGVDIMGGALANRDSSATEQVAPAVMSGVYGARRVNGKLTVAISNNSVASARLTIILYYYR